jgi:Fe-S-cluster-containing dehydrogenase component
MKTSRRNFFKLAALTGVTAVAGKAEAKVYRAISDHGYGMIYDTVRCIGCRTCEQSCGEQNKQPKPEVPYDEESVLNEYRKPTTDSFTVVNRYRNPEGGDPVHVKSQCMHCSHPACASACIVNAFSRQKEGAVVWNEWRCIGCRVCMIACPFQIPKYEYHKAIQPRVRKCTFCYHDRTSKGIQPACAENCPADAITFGKRKDMLIEARTRIRENPDEYLDHIYGEHEVHGTAKLYLAPKAIKDFSYIRLDTSFTDEPVPHFTEPVQHGVFKYFIPPVAAYALLGAIMAAGGKNHGHEDEGEKK